VSTAAPDSNRNTPRPWYREPFVWLLITFPALAVVGGLATIAIAIVSDDGLVVDDYYQRGKQINRVLARDRVAAALQLNADVSIDPHNAVQVTLRASQEAPLPENVEFGLAFATRAGIDQNMVLRRSGAPGHYVGKLQQPLIAGRWYVQLQTQRWRLVGVLQAPLTGRLQLRSKP